MITRKGAYDHFAAFIVVQLLGSAAQCHYHVPTCFRRLSTVTNKLDLMPVNTDFLLDGTDVMFNKFNLGGALSPPDNTSEPSNMSTPDPTTSDLSCVIATNGVWKLSDCDERHGVVCQSDEQLPGTFGTVSYTVSIHTSAAMLLITLHDRLSLVHDAYSICRCYGLFNSVFITVSSCSLFCGCLYSA